MIVRQVKEHEIDEINSYGKFVKDKKTGGISFIKDNISHTEKPFSVGWNSPDFCPERYWVLNIESMNWEDWSK